MRHYPTASESAAPEDANSHDQSGFTLLEIMVAMVVLTMIVTTAFGALRLGERSWEAGLKHTAKTETLRSVTGALQRLFNQTLPISWTNNTETTIAFGGNHEQLRFIAPAPLHYGATGLFEYTLAVELDADNKRLMLYYRLHNPDSPGFEANDVDRQEVMLVNELNTVNLRYYGSPIAKDPPQWHMLWTSKAETFPLLVHIQIVPLSQRESWPDLFLTLHTGLIE